MVMNKKLKQKVSHQVSSLVPLLSLANRMGAVRRQSAGRIQKRRYPRVWDWRKRGIIRTAIGIAYRLPFRML